MRKYTKKLTQHLQIHVCGGVYWVAGGLCEARGSLGSELCEYSMTSEGVNTPNQNFVVVGGDGYFTVTEEIH